MRNRGPHAWIVALALSVSAWASEARADVLPPPTRPGFWDQGPSPMPDPPPEKELERALLIIGLGLGVLAAAGVVRRRRGSPGLRTGEDA